MHDISNVKAEDPVVRICSSNTKVISSCNFKALVLL
jgi:hypothetical protein